MKIGIVGTGNVGCACAMAAVCRGSAREIVLVNRTRKTAAGVAADWSRTSQRRNDAALRRAQTCCEPLSIASAGNDPASRANTKTRQRTAAIRRDPLRSV